MNKNRRILVVDDDRETVSLLTQTLSAVGYSVTQAQDGEAALHRVRAWKPQVILLDINMPGISGLELVPKIRAATPDDYVSILLVSANAAMDDVQAGVDAGADDYLTKPFRAQEILSRVRLMLRFKDLQDSLRRANHRIEELSNTDETTGLLNMKAFLRRGDDEIQRCRRFRKPASALLVNLDGFSAMVGNTDFLFGNKVLRDVAACIRGCIRSIDFVARVGSDEFVVFLPETDLSGAEFAAERIRDGVQGLEIKADKYSAKMTVCIGVAGFNESATSGGMNELFRNATEALQSAKHNGQNQIEIYSFV